MHWEALLKEVLIKTQEQQALSSQCAFSETAESPRRDAKKFFLGVNYTDVYFTGREAEVMIQLLQGKTLNAAAKRLNLSPRTIEFYVKNMKTKLACRTKSELIGKVFASDFVKNVDLMSTLFRE